MLGIVALASCGAEAKILEGDGVQVLVGADDGSNMAGVGLGGTVSVVGDCLGMEERVVIWPPGTEIKQDAPLIIDVPGMGDVKVGDHIEGGGKSYEPSQVPDGVELPDGCLSERVFSFFPNH